MKISTRGRYALRVMLDLAQCGRPTYSPLTEVAQRQDISLKYLESIVATLNRAGLVASQRGKSGGYRLTRPPAQYTVGEILKLTEGGLAPVSCLDCGDGACDRADHCLTLPLWRELNHRIDRYLESVTLEDLLTGRVQAGL